MTSEEPEPRPLVTLDLRSQTPGARAARVVVGVAFIIIFGLLAIGAGILTFVGPFLTDLGAWADVIEWVAPVVGIVSFGLAALGILLVRHTLRARRSASTSV